jgi:hypothetical protein
LADSIRHPTIFALQPYEKDRTASEGFYLAELGRVEYGERGRLWNDEETSA